MKILKNTDYAAINIRQIAQIASYLINKDGGRMDDERLLTLMYLAEEMHMEDHGHDAHITFLGENVNPLEGLALVNALEYVLSCHEYSEDINTYFIIEGKEIIAKNDLQYHIDRNEYDELNDNVIETLNKIYGQYKEPNKFVLSFRRRYKY